MPTTEELLQQYMQSGRPYRIPIFQTGAMMDDSFTSTPYPALEPQEPVKITTPEGYTAFQPTPKQLSSDISAQSEARRGLGLLSTVPGGRGLEEAQTQYQAKLPEASESLTTPIFDVLQSGQYATAGAIQELIRGGTAWDAFKRAAIEFGNAMPGIDLTEYGATRPSFGNILSEEGLGPWGSAVGGFVLDILLDPMTWFGGPIAKGIVRSVKGAVSVERAAQIRKLPPIDWLRKAFIPDVAIKDLGETGEKYLAARQLGQAKQLQEVDTMRDVVTQLRAGLTPEESRLLQIYLDQPNTLKNLVLSVSPDAVVRDRLMQKANDFRNHYFDLADKEAKDGLLDPAIWRSNYIAGRDPTTKLSAKAWEQFAEERGLSSGAAQLSSVQDLPQLPETGISASGGAFSPVLGQATPTFQRAKEFQTIENRVQAAVPTELDIGLSTAQRSLEHIREINSKRLFDAVLSEPTIARRITDDEGLLLNSRSFLDAIKDKGYGVMDAPHWEKGTAPYILPMPIIEDMKKANKIFSDSDEMYRFFKVANTMTSWWKGWALFSPGFHLRNMYSNWLNNYFADVINPVYYAHALAAQAGKEGEIITKAGERIPYAKIIQEMKDQGVYRLPARDFDLPRQVENELYGILERGTRPATSVAATGDLGDAIASSVREGGSEGGSLSLGGVGRALGPSGPIMEWNRRIGSTIEDNARIAHFMTKTVDGLDAPLAARSVKKYLFDYNELTTFERDFLRPLLPFYTWIRKNIPLQLEALVTTPGKYAAVPKLKQEIESVSSDWSSIPTPDYFQEIIATRLPKPEQLGEIPVIGQGLQAASEWAGGGKPLYLNPNLPFQDLNRMNWKDVLSQMNPFIKFFGEWGSGYSSFLDRPIEKYPGEVDQTSPLGLGKKEEYFAEMLAPPYGQVARMIKAGSPQKDALGAQMMSYLTGIKPIAVDVEAVKRAKNLKMRDAIRNAIDKGRNEGWLPPPPLSR